MGFFKEIKCAACGGKTNIISRKKLTDGTYLCSTCLKKLPYYLRDYDFDLKTYQDYIRYIQHQQKLYRDVFRETRSYASIHVDTEHALFYLSDKIIGNTIDDNTLFLRLEDIEDFALVFSPDTYKEGTLGDKLKGNVLMRLKMLEPQFFYEATIVYGETCKVKKSLIGSKFTYQEPPFMTDFLTYFNAARDAVNEAEETYGYYTTSNGSSELQQAMSLFMIDDLNEITPDKLKVLRNRLIMTFHPDVAKGDDNTQYAQKINAAYEILKHELEEK